MVTHHEVRRRARRLVSGVPARVAEDERILLGLPILTRSREAFQEAPAPLRGRPCTAAVTEELGHEDGGTPMALTPAHQAARLQVGIDGCRGGWVAALSRSANNRPAFQVGAWLSALLTGLADDALVAIDVPIGLPEAGPRCCDLAARAFLLEFRHHA